MNTTPLRINLPELRTESDAIGSVTIPADALYGIHTARANQNFCQTPLETPLEIVREIIVVKSAAAKANRDLELLPKVIATHILRACDDALKAIDQSPAMRTAYEQRIVSSFKTHALQGGAGTSSNMNVNEVIANLALLASGAICGAYDQIHPINHVNMSQSTNDVYPTALRMALIYKVRILSESIAALQSALQAKEHAYANALKLGRTQLMDALPITFGQTFGAFARAISRDRWRIYKAEERLREVNIGGTAVGTGMNTSLDYIYMVTDYLQRDSGLGIARADLLVDATQNADVFVEVSGLLKSLATNLLKISNDLRLMNSGPVGGFGEITLEAHQAGSSIMPGKVNPVICEMVNQICFKVIGSDAIVTMAAFSGQLELNPYLPLIGSELINALEHLNEAVHKLRTHCIETLKVNTEHSEALTHQSFSLAAAFIDLLGYDLCSDIAKEAYDTKRCIKAVILERQLLDEETIDKRLSVHHLTQPTR